MEQGSDFTESSYSEMLKYEKYDVFLRKSKTLCLRKLTLAKL